MSSHTDQIAEENPDLSLSNDTVDSNLQKKPKTPAGDLVSGADAGAADEDLKFYLSGLFNIETSPAFKQLEFLKNKKDVPVEK